MSLYAIRSSFLFLCCFLCLGMQAKERTLLVGPKTIGAGWKDNIVVQPEQFSTTDVGDIITVYTTDAKRTAQGAFQDPANWQAIAPEYAYFSVAGPVRMTVTEAILPVLKERGLAIGGHDYCIVRVTHIPAEEMVETVVYRGPSVMMKDDWSAYANIQKSVFKKVKLGDGIHFCVSRVEEGAALKLTDFTYNTLNPAVDGAPVGADGLTYYINEQSQLIQLTLAGSGGVSVRVTGHGFRLDKISIVSFIGEVEADESTAQRAPREFILGPGELFRGEKQFPADWSGNLRFTAEPFQECGEGDCLLISYTNLLPETDPQMSFRENKGKWLDISGTEEPRWIPLNGTDLILTFDDPTTLDHLKTCGLVITGVGFTLTKVELIKIQ